MDDLPIYIDIDGTLTDSKKRGGSPIESRIQHVRSMIAKGRAVVLWSATGTVYARAFAKNHDIKALACLGKPSMCVDDCPTIRPKDKIKVYHPRSYFSWLK